jgi:EmrB/QacA subfamily drug resistance transporter
MAVVGGDQLATTDHVVGADPRRWITLAVVLMAAVLISLDGSVLTVAVPTIIEDLHSDLASVQWVITGYSLTLASLMVIGGRLVDIHGARTMFLIGSVLFGIGSAIAALSTSVAMLVFGEAVLEGIGAAAMMPSTLSILSTTFVGRERAVAFSMWGSTFGVGLAFGPVVGGFLTSNYSWRWAFGINTIAAPIAAVGALVLMARPPRREAKPQLDIAGSVLIATATFCAVLGLTQASQWGWWRPLHDVKVNDHVVWSHSWPVSVVPVVFALAAALAVVFVRVQRRKEATSASPLVELSLLRVRSLRIGLLTLVMLALAQMGVLLSLSVLLQDGRNLSAMDTGLWFVPLGVAMVIGSFGSGRLAARLGSVPLVRSGTVCVAVGMALTAVAATEAVSFWAMVGPLTLIGFGGGVCNSLLNSVTLSEVPADRSGTASGALVMTRHMAGALSVATMGAIISQLSRQHGLAVGVRGAFVFAALTASASAMIAWRLPQDV